MTLRNHIEAWEHALALLADDIYLDIVRNFMGKVPTPFHKPLLTKKLTNLFSTEEFIRRIESSFSDLDRRILTGAYVLGTPTQSELCSLFEGAVPYATLQQNVVNLEERLLLVPNPDALEESGQLMLNPLLRERLLTSSLSIGDLFPPSDTEAKPSYRLSDGDPKIVRALLSLHIHASLGSLDRSERLLRNKYIKAIFGREEPHTIEQIVQYNRLLFHTQVVCEQGKNSIVVNNRAETLIAAKPATLQYLLFRTAWQTLSTATETALSTTELSSFFSIFSILVNTATLTEEVDIKIACRIAALKSGLPLPDFDELLTILETVGLTTTPLTSDELIEDPPRLTPTIDSDLTISFTQDIPVIPGKANLHSLAIVKKVDIVSSYEINKATILKAFDLGLTVEDILHYLEALTKNIPQSLKDSLGHWQQEYTAITIYDGIVVKTDERLSRIIDALPTLQPYILATIGPGIYLLSREEEPKWRDILTSTGIGLLPSSIGDNPKETHPSTPLEINRDSHAHFARLLDELPEERPPFEPVTDFQNELHTLVRKKSFNKAEKEELQARIERKLLLVPSQIVALQGHSKTMQASGFDFQGKVNLCKATINSKIDLLELQMLDEDGNSHILLTEAKELISSSDAQGASIRVSVLPEQEEKVIPIAKVFRVRKLRRSIFFQS